GFEKYLRTAEERGLVFAVFVDERNLGAEELDLTDRSAGDIRIQPIVQGSKQAGMFQTLELISAAPDTCVTACSPR
ncbi:hypothetical protein Q6289_29215, partial [Klebsiella pneumoniae]|nr:hypothetical protein [Klebsiella pneumoniae]